MSDTFYTKDGRVIQIVHTPNAGDYLLALAPPPADLFDKPDVTPPSKSIVKPNDSS